MKTWENTFKAVFLTGAIVLMLGLGVIFLVSDGGGFVKLVGWFNYLASGFSIYYLSWCHFNTQLNNNGGKK